VAAKEEEEEEEEEQEEEQEAGQPLASVGGLEKQTSFRSLNAIEELLSSATGLTSLTLVRLRTMRVQLIGHFEPCMTDIYLHIDARMADYMATHP